MNLILIYAGGENDDSRRGDIRCLLATLSRLLRGDVILPGSRQLPSYSGDISGHLLAGYEQLHV